MILVAFLVWVLHGMCFLARSLWVLPNSTLMVLWLAVIEFIKSWEWDALLSSKNNKFDFGMTNHGNDLLSSMSLLVSLLVSVSVTLHCSLMLSPILSSVRGTGSIICMTQTYPTRRQLVYHACQPIVVTIAKAVHIYCGGVLFYVQMTDCNNYWFFWVLGGFRLFSYYILEWPITILSWVQFGSLKSWKYQSQIWLVILKYWNDWLLHKLKMNNLFFVTAVLLVIYWQKLGYWGLHGFYTKNKFLFVPPQVQDSENSSRLLATTTSHSSSVHKR